MAELTKKEHLKQDETIDVLEWFDQKLKDHFGLKDCSSAQRLLIASNLMISHNQAEANNIQNEAMKFAEKIKGQFIDNFNNTDK